MSHSVWSYAGRLREGIGPDALLDSVFDRMGEMAMWAGLMVLIASSPLQVVLCSAVLGFSFLISFHSARARPVALMEPLDG